MAQAKFCTMCGAPLAPASHFCANCGAPIAGSGTPGIRSEAARGDGLRPGQLAPWLTLGALMMALLGYVIGSRGMPPTASPTALGAFDDGRQIIAASDISSLSPEERVDRLFNRVMALSAAGRADSVQFFAPMAINALAALMPLDVHRRYDLGLIHLATGDVAAAGAQADTILAEQPTHLLGLSLGMRVATAQGRSPEARQLGARLAAAAPAERAKGLREYADHAPDIAEALEEAAGLGRAPR